MQDIKIFSGTSNVQLAQNVAKQLDLDISALTISKFKDGETCCKVVDEFKVIGRDVFIIQSTSKPTNDNLLELLIMAAAIKRSGSKTITAVIPYFGYARQDRKTEAGMPITAKLVADLIQASNIDRLIVLDIHSAHIVGFFNILVEDIYASDVFLEHLKSNTDLTNAIIVSPDVGGVARARKYSEFLGLPLAIVDKKRDAPNQSCVMNIIGDVEGKLAILVDDMVDTAGTLMQAAKALKTKGATKVIACCTHGVLSDDAGSKIEQSEIEELLITDTITPTKEYKNTKILSVDGVIADAIKSLVSK